MAFRNAGDVVDVSVSNAEKHSLSGINTGGTSSSHHQLNVFIGAWPREIENTTPHTYTRTGGSSQFNCVTLHLSGAALNRQQGVNYATAVQSSGAGSISFPQFQPRSGNSVLLYIATIQVGTGGSPYFSAWNAPQLTRAGGTSSTYNNGYQSGTTSTGYGAIVMMPYVISSGLPDLIAPVTCNISAVTTWTAAIIELEAGLDYDRL